MVDVTTDNGARLHAEIPDALKEKLRQADGTMTENLVEALEIYFGEAQADSRAAIKRQINRLEEQRARGQQLIQDGEDMVQEAEEGLQRLEKRLEELDGQTTSYDSALDDLLVDMTEEDMSVQPDHGRVKRLAKRFNKSRDEVFTDLKERSDLHESYFTPGAPEEPETDELAWLNGGDDE